MPPSSDEDTRQILPPERARCPECGSYITTPDTHCPQCGYPVIVTTPIAGTRPMGRPPSAWPIEAQGQSEFKSHAGIVLQFLPSGYCVTLDMDQPLILGRELLPDLEETVLDLNDFNALQHGVSRHHCQLIRRGTRLVVVDLGSTNGTFLNNQPLLPHRDYTIAHGDKLILGTLHIIVSFSVI